MHLPWPCLFILNLTVREAMVVVPAAAAVVREELAKKRRTEKMGQAGTASTAS